MQRKLFLLALSICCASSDAVAQVSANFPLNQVATLVDSIHRIMKSQHVPSLMLAVVTRDTTLFVDGLGLANIDTRKPATNYTLFPMASITKTFTALAIMRLIEQGKLTLDTPLKMIAPEVPFTNAWEGKHPVKLIHLLEHTTGFDDVHFDALFNTGGPISEYKAVLRFKKSMYCRWYPGERMAYCNTDYVILGYLIEKLSGQTYEAFLTDQVLRPLGMTHSYLNEIHSPALQYAQGYSWEEAGFTKIPPVIMYGKGQGALYSCAADMAKFVQFFLRNGQPAAKHVFSASTIDQMEVPTSSIPAQSGMKTGYGLGITTGFLTAKFPFCGHGGLSIDFASHYAYNRQLGVGFVVCGADVRPFSDLLIHFLTQPFRQPKPIPAVSLDSTLLKPYLGYYRLKTPRFQIFRYLEEAFHGYYLDLEGDSLVCYGFKRPKRILIPVTATSFRKKDENLPSILVTKNKQGKAVLYDWGAYFEKVSFAQILAERILLFGSLFSAIGLFISMITWFCFSFYRKMTWYSSLSRSLSSVGVCFLFIAFSAFAYLGSNPETIGSFNFLTFTYFVGTLLFAALSMLGFIVTVNRFRKIKNRWTIWYLLITTTWLLYLVFFLNYYDLLGLRMWSF